MDEYLNPVRIRVLHVDDDPMVLELTQIFLRREGEFEITSVDFAEEALAKLEKGRFDVIISDCRMPGMDGLEFLEEVRETRDSIPFVFFTGIENPEIIEEAWKKGADRYITKNGNPAAQCNKLARAMRFGERREREYAMLLCLELVIFKVKWRTKLLMGYLRYHNIPHLSLIHVPHISHRAHDNPVYHVDESHTIQYAHNEEQR